MPFEIDPHQIIAFVKAQQAYAPLIVFLIAAGKTVIGLAAFLPVTILLYGIGGLLAASGAPLMPSFIACWMGASLGFSVMYLVGASFGPQLLMLPPLQRHSGAVNRVLGTFRRWGALGVIAGEFLFSLRVLVPILAGVTRLAPVPFMIANLIGSALWTVGFFLPGYLMVSSAWFQAKFPGLVVP